jgi:hypothetical protein
MSGYGTLISICSREEFPVSAYCIEQNPPSYFWQLLINPSNSRYFSELCDGFLDLRNKWPHFQSRALISPDWFPSESKEIIKQLFRAAMKISGKFRLTESTQQQISLAFLLPFVGRLSSCVQGNIVTHVKEGGIVVLEDWESDFEDYICFLKNHVHTTSLLARNRHHTSILADCTTFRSNKNKFSAMITSPPYPNSRDYALMFGPENEILRHLQELGSIGTFTLGGRLIGCPSISEQNGRTKKSITDVVTPTAQTFLKRIQSFQGSKQVNYDNSIYYLPYFANYFSDLERAYLNISKSLATNFEGFIVTVNNTHRKNIIPVAQSVIEIWKNLGFQAEIVDEYTRELAHVGGINPRVKGYTARHVEYTIRVFRHAKHE